MSALPPEADIRQCIEDVCFVPEADVTLEFVISSRHRGSGVGGCAMKITLDISTLVEEGQLTREEADKLTALAAHDTGSLGVNILIGFGVIAIAAGAVALVPTPLTAVGLGLRTFRRRMRDRAQPRAAMDPARADLPCHWRADVRRWRDRLRGRLACVHAYRHGCLRARGHRRALKSFDGAGGAGGVRLPRCAHRLR